MVTWTILIKILFYFLSVYGIATIIASEYIMISLVDKFKKWPKIYYLLTCNKCMTVWVGFLISLCGFGIMHPLIDPFAAYTITSILNIFFDRFDVSHQIE